MHVQVLLAAGPAPKAKEKHAVHKKTAAATGAKNF
jgi:hypothetical protein